MRRISADRMTSFAEVYRMLAPGALIDGTATGRERDAWDLARADSLAAAVASR